MSPGSARSRKVWAIHLVATTNRLDVRCSVEVEPAILQRVIACYSRPQARGLLRSRATGISSRPSRLAKPRCSEKCFKKRSVTSWSTLNQCGRGE
jgi:hypothetical protein